MSPRSHLERSEVESKDPVSLLGRNAMGFLDSRSE